MMKRIILTCDIWCIPSKLFIKLILIWILLFLKLMLMLLIYRLYIIIIIILYILWMNVCVYFCVSLFYRLVKWKWIIIRLLVLINCMSKRLVIWSDEFFFVVINGIIVIRVINNIIVIRVIVITNIVVIRVIINRSIMIKID